MMNPLQVQDVDISRALSDQERLDIVINFLREKGIDTSNLLFTGIRGTRKRIEQLLNYGNRRDAATTFAHSTRELREWNASDPTAFSYAMEHDKDPILVVYDGEKLTKDSYLDFHEYKPAEGSTFREALLAVLRLVT